MWAVREAAAEAGTLGSEPVSAVPAEPVSLPISGDSLPSSLGTQAPTLCESDEPVGPRPHVSVPTTNPRGAPRAAHGLEGPLGT